MGVRQVAKGLENINVWYFFVTDQINSGAIKIEYCPNLDIIGDYFTKPLQGSLFQNFRNVIIGIEEADVTNYNTNSHEWIKDT